jgi:hypothetical protein
MQTSRSRGETFADGFVIHPPQHTWEKLARDRPAQRQSSEPMRYLARQAIQSLRIGVNAIR